ncbi:MAG: mechanosensitive ion channel domain-containing protein [Thiofilum sp.]|uniref:mechanosensitive ion channel domain-containing protein n=1 Tax=Thiofilum sp. TaxID=2212733 RepID=UPI0025F5EA6C|nr:mechanosensitive ion channel domain-containing protein [Thiofilum sp.]MBK8451873.1 mechanosensitive ion channel [Thiofilum sp.]
MLRYLTLFLALVLLIAPPSYGAEETLLNLLTGEKEATIEVDNKSIATDTTLQDDQKIQKRLNTLYAEINGLENLKVQVRNGVVTLQGELNSNNDSERAVRFARQVSGVVAINNRLTVNRTIERRLNTTWERLRSMVKDTIGNIPIFLLALVVFGAFWWLGSLLSRQHKLYRTFSNNYFIASLIGQIINLLVVLIGLFVALTILDATELIKTILGAASIVGLAIGFAVRDTVENYIASILLSLRNPFNVNDLVKIENQEGRVARLNSRATILISAEGNHIRIPNSTVFKAVITNYSRNPQRRFTILLAIHECHDVLAIQSLVLTTLKTMPNLLTEPKPEVLIQSWDNGLVQLQILAWVDQTAYSLNRVRSETLRSIKATLDQHQIGSPTTTYDIRMVKDEADTAKPKHLTPEDLPLANHSELYDTSAHNDAAKAQVIEERDPAEENLLNPHAPKEL